MIQFSKNELDAKWDLLNSEIREAILSDKIDNLVKDLLKKSNLGNLSEDIITLCIYAIHGLLDQNRFFSELTALVGPEESPSLAKNLIARVIIPILSLRPEEEAEEEIVIVAPQREPAMAPDFAPSSPKPSMPVDLKSPIQAQAGEKTGSTSPTVSVSTPQIPSPEKAAPETAPAAPFIIHAEAEPLAPVKETKKSLAEPVRPSFYEEKEGEATPTAPLSYAKLQFSASKPTIVSADASSSEEKAAEAPLEESLKLRDLPL